MMGNIHIQPYNPEYIGVLHIFGDFRVDKFPFPLIAYLHVDTLHIEKRNKRKRSFCNTRQSIYSIIQVVSCMRAQRWRSNAAPRFSSPTSSRPIVLIRGVKRQLRYTQPWAQFGHLGRADALLEEEPSPGSGPVPLKRPS